MEEEKIPIDEITNLNAFVKKKRERNKKRRRIRTEEEEDQSDDIESSNDDEEAHQLVNNDQHMEESQNNFSMQEKDIITETSEPSMTLYTQFPDNFATTSYAQRANTISSSGTMEITGIADIDSNVREKPQTSAEQIPVSTTLSMTNHRLTIPSSLPTGHIYNKIRTEQNGKRQ